MVVSGELGRGVADVSEVAGTGAMAVKAALVFGAGACGGAGAFRLKKLNILWVRSGLVFYETSGPSLVLFGIGDRGLSMTRLWWWLKRHSPDTRQSNLSKPETMQQMKTQKSKPVQRTVMPHPQHAHEVRIIGGIYKRTKLPVANKPGLRPTPDRVRETLFNWLGQDLTGWACLDAFAGTGALGLEAASRGASLVELVETDAKLTTQLNALVSRLGALGVRVVRGDGVAAIRLSKPNSLDLVLIDPPFDSGMFEAALLAASQAIKPNGFVYLEAPLHWDDANLESLGLKNWRHFRAGAVHAHLLQPLYAGLSQAGL